MLPQGDSYEAVTAAFRWQIPGRYNMAWDVCDRWAEAEPDRVAVIDGAPVSYGALRAMADRLATHLVGLGVGPGDRVGVLRLQSAWTAAAHIAIWKIGAISMPLFPLFGAEALASRIGNAEARFVVTDEAGAARVKALGVKPVLPDALPETGPFETADTSAEDPALLLYTSGTTGAPKGALHAHRVLLGHLPGVEMSHDGGFLPGDVLWTPADWAWIGGLFDVLMPGLHHGVPVVAARARKFDPAEAARLIERFGITNVFLPPSALKAMKAAGVSVAGLRTVASGGEPLGPEMLAWGQSALGVTINEFYGQTEANMLVSSAGRWFPPRPGAAGRAVPGHDVRVIDADETGEGDIAVHRSSPVVMLGYWRNPEATAEKFRGDWLVTGDRGVIEDGFIRFIGREDDVITSSGYRIGPGEIEDCLLRHPAVTNVGVVGRPDPDRTEIVEAHVVLAPGVAASDETRAALQDHVKTHLAAHAYPRSVVFAESLPMTVTGKIIRRALRETPP